MPLPFETFVPAKSAAGLAAKDGGAPDENTSSTSEPPAKKRRLTYSEKLKLSGRKENLQDSSSTELQSIESFTLAPAVDTSSKDANFRSRPAALAGREWVREASELPAPQHNIFVRAKLQASPNSVEALNTIPAALEWRATALFSARGISSLPTSLPASGSESMQSALDGALINFSAAMMYWSHPATSLPPEVTRPYSRAMQTISETPSVTVNTQRPHGPTMRNWTGFFLTRRRDWESSFKSLFFSLQAGCGTDCFYLQTEKYTVLWRRCSGNGQGAQKLEAIMSQSTKPMRTRLQEAGIEFTTPLVPNGHTLDKVEADEAILAETTAYRPRSSYESGGGEGATAAARLQKTLLHFSGQTSVHGLFELMLEDGGAGGARGGQDVPLLLSRSLFLHGTVRKLQVRSSGQVTQQALPGQRRGSVSASTVERGANAPVIAKSMIELVGPILPGAVTEMSAALLELGKLEAQDESAMYSSSGAIVREDVPREGSFKLSLTIEKETEHLALIQEGGTSVGDAGVGILNEVVGRWSRCNGSIDASHDYCLLNPVQQARAFS